MTIPGTPTREAETQGTEDAPARPARVIIVDDDRIARESSAALLLSEGYELAFAENGQRLLTSLQEVEPDVILLDVMMPGMDGFEICEALKSDRRWRRVPIILVTGLDSREDLIRGLNAGADEFLAKPVNGSELRARVRTMLRIKRQHDRLHANLELRRDLGNMIVHDMRTPLSAMMLYCQLMRERGRLEAEDRQDLAVIESQAQRLDGFIKELLVIAKMEGDRLIVHRGPVSVNKLVENVGSIQRAAAESKGVILELELPERAPRADLDASLFDRVVDNLLSNAIKVSERGQTVRLELSYPAFETGVRGLPAVRIRVLDEGPGVPEEQRDLIFDLFEVVDRGEGNSAQIGLGLTFARKVVEAHGGRLWVESNRPRGAVFQLEL